MDYHVRPCWATVASMGNEALLSVHLAASVASVEADYPGWQVWWVPVLTNGYLWCARRHSNPQVVLHAATADLLRQAIADSGG